MSTRRAVSRFNAWMSRRSATGTGRGYRWRWSLENWLKGYKWGPISRCRTCDHTTPYHYPTCRGSL